MNPLEPQREAILEARKKHKVQPMEQRYHMSTRMILYDCTLRTAAHLLASEGVKCLAWWKVRPLQSEMATMPHTCVEVSMLMYSKQVRAARNISSILLKFGSHKPMRKKESHHDAWTFKECLSLVQCMDWIRNPPIRIMNTCLPSSSRSGKMWKIFWRKADAKREGCNWEKSIG